MIPFYEKRSDVPQIFQTSDMTFAAHLHAQLELLYCAGGVVEVTVGASTRLLHPGELAVIFPDSVHSYRTPPQVEGNRFLVSILPTQLAGPYTNSLLKSHPAYPFILSENLHRDVPYCMRALLRQSKQKNNFGGRETGALSDSAAEWERIYSIYTQLILCRILPQLQLVDNTDGNFFDLTYRLVTYVSQNFRSPLSLASLARALNVSPFHLSHVFSERLHVGFNEYLNALRVARAQELLRGTDLPITQLAFDCGFESQRTFNRAFKEQTGQSPRQFRKGR
ncbi:MAG TPA: AraC family transcriptional regulator [Candidatus Gallacutalibacter stercoravium]|nr:AraC family transcriptional regulator [Candidatus Gallacutalibacter stercoravium]